jgi:hypothetical protein
VARGPTKVGGARRGGDGSCVTLEYQNFGIVYSLLASTRRKDGNARSDSPPRPARVRPLRPSPDRSISAHNLGSCHAVIASPRFRHGRKQTGLATLLRSQPLVSTLWRLFENGAGQGGDPGRTRRGFLRESPLSVREHSRRVSRVRKHTIPELTYSSADARGVPGGASPCRPLGPRATTRMPPFLGSTGQLSPPLWASATGPKGTTWFASQPVTRRRRSVGEPVGG